MTLQTLHFCRVIRGKIEMSEVRDNLPVQLAFELSGHEGPVRAVRFNSWVHCVVSRDVWSEGCVHPLCLTLCCGMQEMVATVWHVAVTDRWGYGTLTKDWWSRPIRVMEGRCLMQTGEVIRRIRVMAGRCLMQTGELIRRIRVMEGRCLMQTGERIRRIRVMEGRCLIETGELIRRIRVMEGRCLMQMGELIRRIRVCIWTGLAPPPPQSQWFTARLICSIKSRGSSGLARFDEICVHVFIFCAV